MIRLKVCKGTTIKKKLLLPCFSISNLVILKQVLKWSYLILLSQNKLSSYLTFNFVSRIFKKLIFALSKIVIGPKIKDNNFLFPSLKFNFKKIEVTKYFHFGTSVL